MRDPNPGLGHTSGYEIRTQGHISDRWSNWFEGFDLRLEADGTTVISSPALDQAALHGLLAKVRDLALPLISVTPSDLLDPVARDTDSTTTDLGGERLP
jgi:hypothetical protein